MQTAAPASARSRHTLAGRLLLGGVFAVAILSRVAGHQQTALSADFLSPLFSWMSAAVEPALSSVGLGGGPSAEQLGTVWTEPGGPSARGIFGGARGIFGGNEEFEPPEGMPRGTKCTYMDVWIENAFNSILQKLVEAVLSAPVLTHLPMELWVQVGPVKAAVRNMTLVGLELGKIRMGQCYAPAKSDFGDFVWEHTFGGWHPGQWIGETFSAAQEWKPGYFMGKMMDFTPQMLPDAFLVEIHLANVTDALTVHYDGVLGIGAFDADAVSDQGGAIDLTATYTRGGETKVTGCDGQFKLGSTHLYGPMGTHLDMPVREVG